MSLALQDPVTKLKGVGPSAAQKLARLGIENLTDLLLHLPSRYQDRTRSVQLNRVEAGKEVLVTGRITAVDMAYGSRRSLAVVLCDDTGYLTMRLFHFAPRQQDALRPGVWVRCFGEVRLTRSGLEMIHPEYRVFTSEPAPPTPELTPIYPATEGLSSARIRGWMNEVIGAGLIIEGSRLSVGGAEHFAEFSSALRFLHQPDADASSQRLAQARARLAFDELLAHFLVMKRRQLMLQQQNTMALPSVHRLGRRLLDDLGFELTGAQRRVATEVLTDLDSPRPMMRLIQGDVGSGKTVIAAFAAIRAAENNAQTAIMAPTEILAEQHFETFSTWLTPLGIDVALLTGRQTARERAARLESIRQGSALVAIGTHALFQDQVEFANLALAIIDEQHRFGVHQRMSLRDKGRLPHQLIMTATPIPRTLTMALYADMDVSVIDELPRGRKPITTTLVSEPRRQDVIERVAAACAAGRQVYWVCTLIEESDNFEARDAESTFNELAETLPGLRIGLVHGRLSRSAKTSVMAAFKARQIDLLVATTVIEVGVDVPNASLMVIDNPERLGLAQLHQLRGRIGRGPDQSHCILLYGQPLSDIARQRLHVMRSTADGFEIAEKDLDLRGPGDILGPRQTGDQTFRIADLARDAHMVPKVTETGARLLQDDPATAQRVVATWSAEAVPGELAGYVTV